jgi:hypothetical protein
MQDGSIPPSSTVNVLLRALRARRWSQIGSEIAREARMVKHYQEALS